MLSKRHVGTGNEIGQDLGVIGARTYTTSRDFLQAKSDNKLYLRFILNEFCGLHYCGANFVNLAFNKKNQNIFFFYIAGSFHKTVTRGCKLRPLKQRSFSEASSRLPTHEVFYCVNKPRFQAPQTVTLNDKITRVISHKRGGIGPSYLICVHGDLQSRSQERGWAASYF